MRKIPTDLQVLQEIYDRYYHRFAAFSKDSPDRSTKVFVPVDLTELASHFKVDVDIIFGRLYYHLEKKFGYSQPDGSKVSLFTPRAGADSNCVNFPLLASVLAGLREERGKHLWAVWFAIASLVISIVSIILSLARGQ